MYIYKKDGQDVLDLLDSYLQSGLSNKSYGAWTRLHFPKLGKEFNSTKKSIEMPAKEVLIAISKTKVHRKTQEKKNAWVTAVSKELNAPFELPFIEDNELIRKLLKWVSAYMALSVNVVGYSYQTRLQINRDMRELLNEILSDVLVKMNIKYESLAPVPWSHANEIIKPYVDMSAHSLLQAYGFCDDSKLGPYSDSYGNLVEARIVYLCLILHLWSQTKKS